MYTIQWCWYIQSCATITTILFWNLAIPLTKETHTHQHHSPFPPPLSPKQLLLYFMSLWICPFWTFHVNGIVSTWPFVTDFFHLTCFVGSSVLQLQYLIPSHGWIIFHCMAVPYFTQSSVDGHLGCLSLWPLCVDICLYFSWVFIPRSGTAGLHGSSMFNILKNSQLFCKVTTLFYNPTGNYEGSTFSTSSLTLTSTSHLFLILALLVSVDWCVIVVLICISLMTNDDEYLFMCLLAICLFSVETYLFKSIARFKY